MIDDKEVREFEERYKKDNIIGALVKSIAGSQKFGEFNIPHRYSADIVPGLLEESVIPDLKKLGLEHLVCKLQDALIEEYKKDLPDPEFHQVSEEDMHFYVPDFTKKDKAKGGIGVDHQSDLTLSPKKALEVSDEIADFESQVRSELTRDENALGYAEACNDEQGNEIR